MILLKFLCYWPLAEPQHPSVGALLSTLEEPPCPSSLAAQAFLHITAPIIALKQGNIVTSPTALMCQILGRRKCEEMTSALDELTVQ